MDNATIHKSQIVEEAIQEAGAKLIYLSPYSPEFSPIENFWSKLKEILKKFQPRNYEDLVIGITEAMQQVTQQDIRNWFAHCCYCTRMSLVTAISLFCHSSEGIMKKKVLKARAGQ